MSGLRLYGKYLAVLIKAKVQYPASFLMLCAATFLGSGIDLLGIVVLFKRFDQINGWTLPEVAVMYGIIKMAFALGEGLGRGFDQFGAQVKSGDFDLVLLRPRSTALQVAGQEAHLIRAGAFLQAGVVLAWAFAQLELGLSPERLALTAFAVTGGTCMFFGLFVLQATLAFWTTETLEVMNTLTYGGADLGQYPVTIYPKWFRRFFTFMVPIACITYFPVLTIVGKEETFFGAPIGIGWITPTAGIGFLFASLAIWNLGVRHYRSTGS